MIKKHIPNFITSLNVLCGSLAVVFAIKGHLTIAVSLIILAAVFDFLDGMVARMLKAWSPIGKELDSLADVISFGLAPGLLMYKLIESNLLADNMMGGVIPNLTVTQWLQVGVAFLIPIFSALRLAKFNVDVRQTNSFIGLPTPANALFISSLAIIKENGTIPELDQILLSTPVLIGITFLFCYLLVAEIPMFALKFKNLKWKANQVQYIFIICSLLLIAYLGMYSISVIILLFIGISVFLEIFRKN